MSEQKMKRQKMYLLNVKAKRNSEIFGLNLWPPSSPNFKPLDYDLWGILENKRNATSRSICSLKTAIETE